MKKKLLFSLVAAGVAAAATALVFAVSRGRSLDVLAPAGQIAREQRELLIFGSILSLVVVIPVFALTLFIVIRYRESNKKATFRPDWDHDRKLEAVWWGIPIVLIGVLAAITWTSTHRLDPFKPLDERDPLTIQVIALDWKWLFIYPNEGIATVNAVKFPEDVAVRFRITSDAPMNAFWIPKLGGMVYAMSGMATELYLQADEPGTYRGSSANISGEGFADMVFDAQSLTRQDYSDWVVSVRNGGGGILDLAAYESLAAPGRNTGVMTFAASEAGLYDTVISRNAPIRDGGTAASYSERHGRGH